MKKASLSGAKCAKDGHNKMFSLKKASYLMYKKTKELDKLITCPNMLYRVTFAISDNERKEAREKLNKECERLGLFED